MYTYGDQPDMEKLQKNVLVEQDLENAYVQLSIDINYQFFLCNDALG